jgi:large subunit ribosomal protein L29
MPILSLQKDRAPQFPCIGKLRKGGAKRKNAQGKEIMGEDLKYFRFTTDDAHAAETFAAYYGAQPQSVEVFLPYATTAENFGAWLEEYTAGGMTRRCDGETQHFHRDADGKGNTTPVKCERLCGRKCGCKEVGRLAVIVPHLARLAYITVETHSLYDIMQLTENLQAAEALRGDLRGIPFILSRRDREISTPGADGKRTRRTKSLLFIEPNPEWVARQLESMRLAALPIVDVPALQAPASRMIAGPTAADFDDDDELDDEGGDEAASPSSERKEVPPRSTPAAPATATTTGNGAAGNGGNGRKGDALSKAFHASGARLYGQDWDAKRHEIVRAYTKGRTESSRELTPDELRAKLNSGREKLFDLKFKNTTAPLKNPREIRAVRKDIARALTILRQKGVSA